MYVMLEREDDSSKIDGFHNRLGKDCHGKKNLFVVTMSQKQSDGI